MSNNQNMKEPTSGKIFFVTPVKDSIEDGRKKSKNEGIENADFETAVTATKFGKFNVILLILSIPACFCSIFETTTMSYVFPTAQCDLDLTLSDKGLLNAITYSGMITSALVWGFLYDTLGRKRLLVIGFLADAFFVFLSSFSQDITLLLVTKYLGGFIINGPFAAMSSYLSEFHCSKYRPKIQLLIGNFNSLGSIVLPALSWAILQQQWTFTLFNYLEFHSWNVYLLVCGLPSFFSGVAFLFLPESPKFLMTVGRNKEALHVFQKVYSINTGKHIDTYPIKSLVDETKLYDSENNAHGGHVTANRTKVQALKEGWQQMTPLFFPPYLGKMFLVCFLQLLLILSLNTLRLWLPQIFQAIDDYKHHNNGSSASLCVMLETIRPSNTTVECVVNSDNSSVYINSIIVAIVTIIGYILASSIISCTGKKKLLAFLAVVSGSSGLSIYFAQDTTTTIVLSSLFIALASICCNIILSATVDLFPTTLRTITISVVMMVARCGAMVGNLIFPMLLTIGCAPPFFFVGIMGIGAGLLSLILPNTDMKPLK